MTATYTLLFNGIHITDSTLNLMNVLNLEQRVNELIKACRNGTNECHAYS